MLTEVKNFSSLRIKHKACETGTLAPLVRFSLHWQPRGGARVKKYWGKKMLLQIRELSDKNYGIPGHFLPLKFEKMKRTNSTKRKRVNGEESPGFSCFQRSWIASGRCPSSSSDLPRSPLQPQLTDKRSPWDCRGPPSFIQRMYTMMESLQHGHLPLLLKYALRRTINGMECGL